MARIKILPPDIVNRIAAGEVIERPASVVKELVENSVDAGASEVLVDVEEGGRRRIRVRDNGAGIPPEDLPLAFRSHATSKLPVGGGEGSAAEGTAGGPVASGPVLDLSRIATLGFRGEALASIASVAEVEAVSRTPGAEHAHRYRLRGTEAAGEEARGEGPEPTAGPSGTSIEIRNLFFNTPARRKFLRSSATELSHIVEQVVRLALGFPGIRFTLASGGKRLLDCPATSSLRERLASVIGRERAVELLEVREPEGSAGVKVRGFIGPPHLHRPDTRGQQFFVDGRWVRDRVLGHAVQEAFQGFQIPGQKPLAYLFVEVPPGAVDVNVHPTKSEVRFLDSNAVHRAAHGAVRGALERSPAGAKGAAGLGMPGSGAGRQPQAAGPRPEEIRERVRGAALDFFASRPRGAESPPVSFHGGAGERGIAPRAAGGRPLADGAASAASLPIELPGRKGAVQILQSYILVERDDGIILFDQHALHEKVLYEKILAQLRSGEIPRQKLLIPEVVEMPLELVPLMEEVARRLEPLGFEAEPFGPREMAVHAVPALLDRSPAGPVVIEAARWLLEGGAAGGGTGGSRGADPVGAEVQRLAQLVACKLAVKAGMPLCDEEIRALLRGAESAQDPRFCPHGRPTGVEIGRSELERRFQRR